LLGLLRDAWKEYQLDHARYFAIAMVYYALVSLMPLLLLMLAALGLALRFSNLGALAAQQLLAGVESRFGVELRETVEHLFGRLQQESVVATFVSVVGLLVTASLLFRHLRLGFRAIWKKKPPLVSGSVGVVLRQTVLERAKAFAIVLGGGALLATSLVVMSALQWLGVFVRRVPLFSDLPQWLFAFPARVAIATLMLGFLFKYLPPARLRWRFVWPVAVLCACAMVGGAEVLTFIAARFDSGSGASGALGSVLAIMLLMNVVSQIVFFGAELCKVVHSRRSQPDVYPFANAA
jgi:membrane protein